MIYWIFLLLLTLPVLVVLCRMAFGDLDSLVEAIVYFFTPSGAATVTSEAGDAFWAKLKLVGVALAWIVVIYAVHSAVGQSLQRMFS